MLARQRGVAEVLVFDLPLTPDALVLFVCLLQAVEFMLARCLRACLCIGNVSSDLPSPTVLYFVFCVGGPKAPPRLLGGLAARHY